MFVFENKGQALAGTNFWDSDHARAGYFFLSWNAGAARLLVPDSQKSVIREMKSRYVIISRGRYEDREALEVLFEDGTDTPYSMLIGAEMTDRLIPEADQGGGLVVTIWTRGGMKLRLPGKYRVVGNLPDLSEWVEQ